MKVCTVNVTRLTKARLKDVFSAEPCQGVDIILIQESRHETLSPGWVTKLAENHGFGVACSQVRAKDSGRVRHGGTRVFSNRNRFAFRFIVRVTTGRWQSRRETPLSRQHMGQHSTWMASGLRARSWGCLKLLEKTAQSFGVVISTGESSTTGLWLKTGHWQNKRRQRQVQTHNQPGVSTEVQEQSRLT